MMNTTNTKLTEQLVADHNRHNQILLKLSAVMQLPPNSAGLIPALGALRQILTAAHQEWHPPGLSDLISAVTSLEMHLSASDATPSHFRSVLDPDQVSPDYRLLLIVASGGSHIEVSETIKSILGAAFLIHLISAKPLAAYRAESLISLLTWPTSQSGSRSSWRKFSLSLTAAPAHIAACAAESDLDKIRNMGLWLKDIVTEIEKCIVPPLVNAKVQPIEIDYGDTDLGSNHIEPASPPLQNEQEISEFSESTEIEDLSEVGSLVRWQWQRAIKGSAIGSAGLTDWNMLTPAELKRSVQVVREGLNSKTELEIRFSLAAALSLATALPIRLIVRVSLNPNDDLWIDIDHGVVIWNLDKIIGRDRVSPEIASSGLDPESIIRLPLPLTVRSKLANLPRHGNCIGQLLFPDISIEQAISRFGSFLRNPAGDDPRKPYAARFAYSLGAAIKHATNDSTAAAYAAMDFRHLAPAEPYYLCLPSKRIHAALDKTYQWLGLGGITHCVADGHVGSPFVPRHDVLQQAITELTQRLDDLDQGIGPRSSLAQVADRFNRRTVLTAALFVLLSGERGTNIHRRCYSSIYGHKDLAIICDKETEVATSRLVPLTTEMRNLLDELRSSSSGIATRAQREGHKDLASRLNQIAVGDKPHAPAFFQLKLKEGRGYGLIPLRTEDIRHCIEHFGMAMNAGRHFLLTHLSSPDSPTYLRRILSGHGSKAGQPFHYASGLTPSTVLSELRSRLQEVHRSLGFQYPISGSKGPSRTYQTVRLRPSAATRIENKAVAAFSRFDTRNAGRHSEMFPPNFAASLQHAQELRQRFLSHTSAIAPPEAILISLILIDGITDPEVLPVVWENLTNGTAVRIGKTIWAEIVLNSGRARVYSPLPPTMIALSRYNQDKTKATFDEACKQAMVWACGRHRRITWPTTSEACINALCGLSHALITYEFPCWLTTAQSKELGAASISLSSIARGTSKLPLLHTEKVPSHSLRRKDREFYTIKNVTKILAECARTDSNIGEDRKRKTRLTSSLENLLQSNSSIFPITAAIIEYVIAECKTIPVHGDPIEVSTIYSYLISMHHVLEELRMEHPTEFSREDWLNFVDRLQQSNTKLDDAVRPFDPSPHRRFARYWQSCGADIPSELFADTTTSAHKRAKWSTASWIVWAHEWASLRNSTALEYSCESIQSQMVKLYCDLIESIPLRAREGNYVRLVDFDGDLSLTITSSGFSHLKNQDVSRRSVQLSSQMASNLKNFKKRILDLSPSRTYVFFEGKDPSQDTEFINLQSRFAQSLVMTTGESRIRRHTLRGTAENRIVFKDIDAILQSQCSMPGGIAIEHLQLGRSLTWQGIVEAAKEAGHHPLTALSTYLTFWPIAGRYFNLLRLKEHWPGSGFAEWAGVPSSSVRVIRHRATTTECAALTGWRLLSKQIDPQELSDSYIGLAPNAVFTNEATHSTPIDAFQTDELLARHIWFCGLLLAGITESGASDIAQISFNDHLRKSVMSASLKQFAMNSYDIHARFMRLHGFQIATHLAEVADLAVFTAASTALDASSRRSAPSTEADVIESLECLTKLILPQWTIALLPESKGLPPNTAARLRRLHPSIQVKRPSKDESKRYRFTVADHTTSTKNPRNFGVTTQCFSILLSAAIALLKAS